MTVLIFIKADLPLDESQWIKLAYYWKAVAAAAHDDKLKILTNYAAFVHGPQCSCAARSTVYLHTAPGAAARRGGGPVGRVDVVYWRTSAGEASEVVTKPGWASRGRCRAAASRGRCQAA
jgi:hypothetical protein